ncbi:hypothetical protein ANO11243_001870 [Dothideomycetidae sp. 11243]|nr:hypothetical protein ANO11243_001870 [fungal sp. No.11243]
MPGRLLGFDLGRSAHPSPQTKSHAQKRYSSSASSLESFAVKPSPMEHFKRPTLGKKHSSDSKPIKSRPSSPLPPQKHVLLEIITESPPALFLDDPQRSTGALYSVNLHMTVKDKPITLKTMNLKLEGISTTKRPLVEKCKECSRQVTPIKDWNVITEKTTFQPGTYEFPASHLLPGSLPATTHGSIGSVEYQFVAKAESDAAEHFELTKPLVIQRAIRPGNEKNSVRIFPPTNLSLNVTLPSVVHPMGDFNVTARMSGLTTVNGDTQTRWRLRKLDWRIEEREVSVSPACPKHAVKASGDGNVAHEHTRIIGEQEVKNGWKTDYEAGEIEGEFVCNINPARKPNLDMSASNGLKITHALVVEMIISEEWATNKKPKNSTPTGVARVLRTHFNLTVTERAGMGIAWDDEMPPLYEDVPVSPPAYFQVHDYDGDDLNDDVEHLHL